MRGMMIISGASSSCRIALLYRQQRVSVHFKIAVACKTVTFYSDWVWTVEKKRIGPLQPTGRGSRLGRGWPPVFSQQPPVLPPIQVM